MEVTATLRPEWWALFDPATPNDVILRSALIGRCPSVAFLDRRGSPEQIVIRAHGGKAFASVGASESFLHDALDRIGALGWTALADTGIPGSVRERGRVVSRARFDHCDLESGGLRSLRDRRPSYLEVRALDRGLLARCPHAKRELAKAYGEMLDSYFDFGYGVCLLHRGDVVCEAYTGFVADERMEVIAGTAEPHRGRGLASIASAFLAEEARGRGHAFTWNCLADNAASLSVARRLAFRREASYREIYYQ